MNHLCKFSIHHAPSCTVCELVYVYLLLLHKLASIWITFNLTNNVSPFRIHLFFFWQNANFETFKKSNLCARFLKTLVIIIYRSEWISKIDSRTTDELWSITRFSPSNHSTSSGKNGILHYFHSFSFCAIKLACFIAKWSNKTSKYENTK